ncbi:hypothetical protein [Xanthomonas campestris]|uniref:hypothetical protein n=1 Tax=Xanthomonas campestris TaxID=339 RepID=UPI00388D1842
MTTQSTHPAAVPHRVPAPRIEALQGVGIEGRLAGVGGQWASGIGLKRIAHLADQVLTCARHARNRCSTALRASGVRGLCAGCDFQRFEQCSCSVID